MWRPLGIVPSKVYDHALRRLPLPPLRFAEIRLAEKRVGELILVPFGAAHLLSDRRNGNRKVVAAVDRAVRSGADLVGLGGLTAPVTNGGMVLRRRTDIGVTNGNAFTAAIVHRQIRTCWPPRRTAGSRWSAPPAASAPPSPDCWPGTVTSPNCCWSRAGSARLSSLAAEVGARVPVRTSDRLDDRGRLRHRGAVDRRGRHRAACRASGRRVRRCSTPPSRGTPARNCSSNGPTCCCWTAASSRCPDSDCTAARWVCPDGRTFACLAETMLLSLSGHRGHFTLGRPTLEQIDHITELALRHSDLGFLPAAPSTFGRPLSTAPAASGLASRPA